MNRDCIMFSIYKGAIEASQTGIVQHGPGHEGSHHWYHLQSVSEVSRLQSSNNATRQHSAGVFTLLLLLPPPDKVSIAVPPEY